jgi:hypothetical protein
MTFKVGEKVYDFFGIQYMVAYVNDDGSFAVDGPLFFGKQTRFHYAPGEWNPYHRPVQP